MSELRQIAALFVATGGVYFGVPDVEPWDVSRDARTYPGTHPVVAHPPCHLWVNFAALNFKRYGGEHNRPAWQGGSDGGCFASALASVRRWGGVLEHPAFTNAYAFYGLPRPTRPGWNVVPDTGCRDWVCEVWQSAYGHRARKRTWLFYASTVRPPFDLDWSRNPGTHQVGWFDRIKPTLSKKDAMATPTAFRERLIALARHAEEGFELRRGGSAA